MLVVVGPSLRHQRHDLARRLRADGLTWPEVAAELRRRWPELTARAAMRIAHGWTQHEVAEEWMRRWPDERRSGKEIGLWENWPLGGRRPSLTMLDKLAAIYQCAAADLLVDVYDHRQLDPAATEMHTGPSIDVDPLPATRSTTEMERRDLVRGLAALGALGLSGDSLARLLGSHPSRDQIIGADRVKLVRLALAEVEPGDSAHGSTDLQAQVQALSHTVEEWLVGPYLLDRGVDDELHLLLGELYAWSGWLAIDAADHRTAARFLQKSLFQARLYDDPRLETRALAYLCLVLTATGTPKYSLECAYAAQRVARGWAPARLTALLHLRSARAHAELNEPAPFTRELAKAAQHLDQGPSPHDPDYIGFVSPMELHGISGLSHLALGQPRRSIHQLEVALSEPGTTYQRNLSYYTIQLARAHAAAGDIDDAAEIASAALGSTSGIRSGRSRRDLLSLRTRLDQHPTNTSTVRDFVDAAAALLT